MTGRAILSGLRLAVLLLLAPLLASLGAPLAQAQDKAATGKIIVGTMRMPPFVLRGDDGIWTGLSIELWKRIAAELKVETEFRSFDYDAEGLLDAVERKQVD